MTLRVGDQVVWPGHHVAEPVEPLHVVASSPSTDVVFLASKSGGPVILVVSSSLLAPWREGMTLDEANAKHKRKP